MGTPPPGGLLTKKFSDRLQSIHQVDNQMVDNKLIYLDYHYV